MDDFLTPRGFSNFPVIAWSQTGKSVLYVSQFPGDGGVDWGFTDRRDGHNGFDKAIPLSRYWWERFAKRERDCGRVAHCQAV